MDLVPANCRQRTLAYACVVRGSVERSKYSAVMEKARVTVGLGAEQIELSLRLIELPEIKQSPFYFQSYHAGYSQEISGDVG